MTALALTVAFLCGAVAALTWVACVTTTRDSGQRPIWYTE